MKFANSKKMMVNYQGDYKNYLKQDLNKFTRKWHQRKHTKVTLIIIALMKLDQSLDMLAFEIWGAFAI